MIGRAGKTKVLKKKESAFKRINKLIHLWLGLISGLIVFVVCITGTLFVFHEEINNFINRDALYVEVPMNQEKVSADVIVGNLKIAYPTLIASAYTEYRDPSRSVRLKAMLPGASLGKSLYAVYANPYTGEILKISAAYGFFRLLVMIHINLMMGSAGSYLVQISTVILLIELISGIIYWWPKKWNKTNVKKSFKIKGSANWKRLNIDLHNVLGFYTLPLAFVLTFTALIICYAPVKAVVFSLFGSTGKELPIYQVKHPADSTQVILPVELLLKPYRSQLEQVNQLTSTLPSKGSGAVLIRLEQTSTLLTFEGNQQFVNVYSGEKIQLDPAIQKADRLLNTVIALHIGAWSGLLGKILTCLVCLICSSLPVTGFIIWYNRKFKKKRVSI